MMLAQPSSLQQSVELPGDKHLCHIPSPCGWENLATNSRADAGIAYPSQLKFSGWGCEGQEAYRKCPKLTLPLPIYPTCAATNEITHTFLYPALDNLKYLRALLLHLQFQASCPVQSQCIIDAGTHDPRSHYGHKQAGYLPHGEHIQNVPVALDVLIALQMTMRTGNE
eukprot:scaffold26988_cov19-Tisochrysis_lutea.AAC.2